MTILYNSQETHWLVCRRLSIFITSFSPSRIVYSIYSANSVPNTTPSFLFMLISVFVLKHVQFFLSPFKYLLNLSIPRPDFMKFEDKFVAMRPRSSIELIGITFATICK